MRKALVTPSSPSPGATMSQKVGPMVASGSQSSRDAVAPTPSTSSAYAPATTTSMSALLTYGVPDWVTQLRAGGQGAPARAPGLVEQRLHQLLLEWLASQQAVKLVAALAERRQSDALSEVVKALPAFTGATLTPATASQKDSADGFPGGSTHGSAPASIGGSLAGSLPASQRSDYGGPTGRKEWSFLAGPAGVLREAHPEAQKSGKSGGLSNQQQEMSECSGGDSYVGGGSDVANREDFLSTTLQHSQAALAGSLEPLAQALGSLYAPFHPPRSPAKRTFPPGSLKHSWCLSASSMNQTTVSQIAATVGSGQVLGGALDAGVPQQLTQLKKPYEPQTPAGSDEPDGSSAAVPRKLTGASTASDAAADQPDQSAVLASATTTTITTATATTGSVYFSSSVEEADSEKKRWTQSQHSSHQSSHSTILEASEVVRADGKSTKRPGGASVDDEERDEEEEDDIRTALLEQQSSDLLQMTDPSKTSDKSRASQTAVTPEPLRLGKADKSIKRKSDPEYRVAVYAGDEVHQKGEVATHEKTRSSSAGRLSDTPIGADEVRAGSADVESAKDEGMQAVYAHPGAVALKMGSSKKGKDGGKRQKPGAADSAVKARPTSPGTDEKKKPKRGAKGEGWGLDTTPVTTSKGSPSSTSLSLQSSNATNAPLSSPSGSGGGALDAERSSSSKASTPMTDASTGGGKSKSSKKQPKTPRKQPCPLYKRIEIPRFFFQSRFEGHPSEVPLSPKSSAAINRLFQRYPEGLDLETFEQEVVTSLWDLSPYFSQTLFQKIDSGKQAVIKRQSLIDFWKRGFTIGDQTKNFFHALRQPHNDFLFGCDFEPFFAELLEKHPGMAFLRPSADFQKRYTETVIARIFYNLDPYDRKRLYLSDLRRKEKDPKLSLPAVWRSVDKSPDLNHDRQYLSYEHFYVIYCTFWELDGNHDFRLDTQDLLKHDNYALSSRVVDRLFSQTFLKFTGGSSQVMSYEDYIYLLINDEEKGTDRSIEFWFRLVDLDCDGYIRYHEMEYFYAEQLERLEALGQEVIAFEDIMCQLNDVFRPKVPGQFTLCDFRKNRKLAGTFFNVLLSLTKLLAIEQRDPFQAKQDATEFPDESDWDRFCRREYERLTAEDDAEEWEEMSAGQQFDVRDSEVFPMNSGLGDS